jgi:glucose/arabinose dehydrogenase
MVQKHEQKKAGAAVESANRITLLRGFAPNGTAATRSVFLDGLYGPFGMALVGKDLYVANADALVRFPYKNGDTKISDKGVKVMDLPAGINHHWTKNVVASPDGKKLYVSVGSNSNVAENGIPAEQGRAAIWEYDIASGKSRVYASGLRNPVGMGFQPQSKALWVSVNERDELGNDLVPDYMTEVKDGAFYGWPYSYYGQHVDTRVKEQKPELVAKAIAPDYALGSHTASLGMTFYDGSLLPQFKNGALVSQHGSWNRKPFAGYKLIFVPFTNGKPSGPPQDVMAGFLSKDGKANGRPVGVAVDKTGAILLADDVGNTVWRITPASATATK